MKFGGCKTDIYIKRFDRVCFFAEPIITLGQRKLFPQFLIERFQGHSFVDRVVNDMLVHDIPQS